MIDLTSGDDVVISDYGQTTFLVEEEKTIYVEQNSTVSYENAVGVTVGSSSRGKPFEYVMPVAQTTAVFRHDLGYDPVAVMVIVDGVVCDEYNVSFPLARRSVMVGFDIPVQARIRIY